MISAPRPRPSARVDAGREELLGLDGDGARPLARGDVDVMDDLGDHLGAVGRALAERVDQQAGRQRRGEVDAERDLAVVDARRHVGLRRAQLGGHRDHRRADVGAQRDRRLAVLNHRPAHVQRARQLHRALDAGDDHVDARVGDRQVARAGAEHLVAERQQLLALLAADPRDGAVGRDRVVAADQHDRHRVAALPGLGRRGLGVADGRAAAAAARGHEAESVGEVAGRLGPEAAHRHRRAERRQAALRRQVVGAASRRQGRGAEAEHRVGPPGRAVAGGRADPVVRQHFWPKGQLADGEHVGDRGDAADRVLVEAVAVGQRADQLAVDVDRAAAHAADDAGVDHPRVGGAEQDRVLTRQVVADDVDDLDLEAVGAGAGEDGDRVTLHAGAHVLDGHDVGPRGGGGAQRERAEQREPGGTAASVATHVAGLRTWHGVRGLDASRRRGRRAANSSTCSGDARR
ncbi:hypothetical protein OV079_43525 [Nannocystis pusilla]|uniref:Uncharacterized protein n=1 Tax=Nannocystis pusilla TaxID=889268 RepID=A0A9X3J2M1_9BACT|nr:hypothetical protein [Nannocystis pusilla]MCY1012295.1 hypothetical protein [Nannocystis pusilla]